MAAGKWATYISENSALQVVGVAANCSGIISSALGIYSFIEGYGQPDNSTILNAINQLQQTLNTDFDQLGNLIQQQTQIIVDTVNRVGMAQALASADVATARIQTFLRNNDSEALEIAESESIAAFEFFSELGLQSPADLLYFMPGLVKAGMVRVFVIASEPLAVREPISVISEHINSMVTLLSAMIDSVNVTTDTAHTVSEKSHTVRCSVIAQDGAAAKPAIGPPGKTVLVIDGYSHDERGTSLEFFDAQQGNSACEQPSGLEKSQLAAAQQARSLGVAGELAFIGMPQFEAILQSWKNLVTVTTSLDLNGTWAYGGVPGPVISVEGSALSVDMSIYKRPTATGSILDSSDISVYFPDDTTYTGKLQPPGTIQWSNDSAWTKA
jgi:hypothetical protein